MQDTRYQPERAIVVTPQTVFYGSGAEHPTPPRVWGNLGLLLDGAAVRFRTEGVLVLVGVSIDELRALTDQLPGGVWRHGEPQPPWTTYRPEYRRKDRNDRRTVVHVCLLDAVIASRSPLFGPADDPAAVAELLHAYHRATGSPWHGTAGVTGCGDIRSRYEHHARGQRAGEPLWIHPGPAAYGAGPLIWHRTLPDDTAGYVHTFDINAQYLNASRNALLAWDALTHTGACPYDPDWSGFWQIDVRGLDTNPDQVPTIGRSVVSGAAWVTGPIMRLLLDRGISPDVLDSWTCPKSVPILRTWAERLRDARAEAERARNDILVTAIKRTYTETVGMMARPGGRIFRPDWYHTIVDQARAALLRRINRARGLLHVDPIRVHIDAVSYLWPSQDHTPLAAALGCSGGMGNFRHVSTLTVDDYRAKYNMRVPQNRRPETPRGTRGKAPAQHTRGSRSTPVRR